MALPSMEMVREKNADIFALRVLPEVLTHNIGRNDDKPALTQPTMTNMAKKMYTMGCSWKLTLKKGM